MKLSTLNSKLNLLAVGTNAKTKKGDSDDSLTAIMYLAPANISGYEVCTSRSPGCTSSCLFTAGRGAMSSVQQARTRKTKLFFENQPEFLKQLEEDLTLFSKYCSDNLLQGFVRLNGTSDIRWEEFGFIQKYSTLNFYDYTKHKDRDMTLIPNNYKLTYSKSELDSDVDISLLIPTINVAVVFDEVPKEYLGANVIEGDLTDMRWDDPTNVIVGLKAKGNAKKDTSGFVVRLKETN